MRLTSFVVLFKILSLVATPSLAIELSEIAEANQATWDAITSADVVYSIRSNYAAEGVGRELDEVSGERRWSFNSFAERVKLRDLHCEQRLDDYFRQGNEVRHFSTLLLDEVFEKQLPPSFLGRSGTIRPAGRYAFAENEPAVLKYIGLFGDDPRTLKEIIAAWECVILERSSDSCTIRAHWPIKDSPRSGSFLDVRVNLKKGCLVECVEAHDVGFRTEPGTTRFVDCRYSLEVLAFESCGDGIYFPKQVRLTHKDVPDRCGGTTSDYIFEYLATSISVNEAVSPDALNFRFPENLPVVELDDNGKERRVLLWGPENEPRLTFASMRRYEQWIDQTREFQRLQTAMSLLQHSVVARHYKASWELIKQAL